MDQILVANYNKPCYITSGSGKEGHKNSISKDKNTKEQKENNQNPKEQKQKGSNRLAHLRAIEKDVQSHWLKDKIFEAKAVEDWSNKESFEEKNKKKFMVTFPFPYMNGRLHLGHGFSLSKAEFQSRYQRLNGKNVLFPFGFHCTGMPIAAAAKKVEKELKEDPNILEKIKDQKKQEISKKDKNDKNAQPVRPKQVEILKGLGVPLELIPNFKDPNYWTDYFPKYGKEDLLNFGVGVDFSRSMITTEKQKYFDKFVQWHMMKLKEGGYVDFGKRNAIFSISDNQACADHDRSEGEGLGPQEFTLIKMELLDTERVPDKVRQLMKKGQKIFLVAATLRPETMYGQTNCYILPSGEYGFYEMKNNEIYLTSEHAILNMAYQDKTKIPRKAEPLLKIKGKELIGVKLNAPLSIYKQVYLFPMETISMGKGTGVVTSVPSDSPDDYINLLMFKTDKKLREKWNITEDMLFEPVHIITLEGFSGLAAKDMVEKLNIKSPKDKVNLQKAKEEVYTVGFYKGVLDIGKYKGQNVKDAKEKVKADLIKSGDADTYFEPEGIVKNRQGEDCVVALVDQWYIKYGEGEWKDFCLNYVKDGKLKTFFDSTKKGFEQVLSWLSYWGLSRTFGLGSHIPWDKQYLIESLSDSTIYMAYYTISNFLHEDIYGKISKNNIEPEMLTEDIFDYIFLGKKINFKKTKIKEEVLKEMRNSFTYWYPMDLRCSGKDLIGNHLTMSLYNHAGVWKCNEDYMPRGYFCNGYILVNGEKMSKNKGNFFTLIDIIEKFGCDASRIGLADCGDTLDDANFVTEISDQAINKLYTFENFVKILINDTWGNGGNKADDNITEPNKINKLNVTIEDLDNIKLNGDFDKMFDNSINYLIQQSRDAYEGMKYKNVLKYGFYEMINVRDEYILFNGDDYKKLNPTLMVKYLRTFFIIINPIIPHWTEYMYRTYLNPIFEKFNLQKYVLEYLCKTTYPVPSADVDKKLFEYNNYINKVITSVRETGRKKGAGKKGKNEKNEKNDNEKNTDVNIKIYYAKTYTEAQLFAMDILKNQKFDDNNKITSVDEKGNPLFKAEIMKKAKGNGKEKSALVEFAAFKAKEIENYGLEALNDKMLFNEEEVLNNNLELIKKLTGYKNIELVEYSENNKPKNSKDAALPGKPVVCQA